jgi:hypothetical protein
MYENLGKLLEGEKCPNGHQIVYNGNFFCVEFDNTHCWAQSHPPRGKNKEFDIEFHNRHGWQCCPR